MARCPLAVGARRGDPLPRSHDTWSTGRAGAALAGPGDCGGAGGGGPPVTLAVLPDEGHFISEQANRVALAALVEAFLQDQAGGPVEDVAEDLVASRMAILQGGDFLPGPVLARLRERNASPA